MDNDFVSYDRPDHSPRNEFQMLREINDRTPLGRRGWSQCRKLTWWDKVMQKTFWIRKYFTHRRVVTDGFRYKGGVMEPMKHITWVRR